MKKRFLTLFIAVIIYSVNASSQTIRDNIDKAAKDKSNAEKAAKADVLIQKKVIYDDLTKIQITPTKVVTTTSAESKTKYKKNKYKQKKKVSSK